MGVHAADHAIYPDCRPLFINAMQAAVFHGSGKLVTLDAPFLHISKGSIVKKGLALKTPFQLTRTCYKDQPVACGKCGSCQERLEAFATNNMIDPLPYESTEFIPKTT